MPGGTPDVNAGGAGTPDIVGPGDGGDGVSDHGELTGLADDDHSHYLDGTRHDSRDHTGVTGVAAWADPILPSSGPGGADDDEFDDAARDAAWTDVTPTGTAVWTEDRDVLSCLFEDQAAADCAATLKAIPGTPASPLTIETAVRMLGRDLDNELMGGVLFTDGTDAASNAIWAQIQGSETNQLMAMKMRTGTLTNFDAASTTQNIFRTNPMLPWIHLRMTWSAANTFDMAISPDGVSWTDWGIGSHTFTLSPTHFGLGVSGWAGTEPKIATFEYFRVS